MGNEKKREIKLDKKDQFGYRLTGKNKGKRRIIASTAFSTVELSFNGKLD